MLKIQNNPSIICYRHCVAERVTKEEGIFPNKTCPVHGESSYPIETDKNFYKQLGYDLTGYSIFQGIMIEALIVLNQCPEKVLFYPTPN